MTDNTLHGYLIESARRFPERTAVEEPTKGTITYAELAGLSGMLRDRLRVLGVSAGDRVGIYMRKSIDAVASIFGILEAGAVYVPVDPGAPASRNAYILNDCSVAAVLIENCFVERFRAETSRLGTVPPLIVLDGTGRGEALHGALVCPGQPPQAAATRTSLGAAGDLA